MLHYLEKEFKVIMLLINISTEFLLKKISILGLPEEIENSIDALENVPKEFREDLFLYWGKIEIEYASMLERDSNSLSREENAVVEQSLQEIIRICNQFLSVSNSKVPTDWEEVGYNWKPGDPFPEE